MSSCRSLYRFEGRGRGQATPFGRLDEGRDGLGDGSSVECTVGVDVLRSLNRFVELMPECLR